MFQVFYRRRQTEVPFDISGTRFAALFSFCLIFAIDLALGQYITRLIRGYLAVDTLKTFPLDCMDQLRANIVWLMGAPAGFKLNQPLTGILGNGVLMAVDAWRIGTESVLEYTEVFIQVGYSASSVKIELIT